MPKEITTTASEVPDYLFRDHIRVPARTFVDTIALEGLEYGDEVGEYYADTTVQSMAALAVDAYTHFGGGGGDQLAIAAGTEYADVLTYIEDYDNHERFGIWARHEAVAQLAHRYLVGDGEDYEAFRSMES
jgi:hypothetical protein